MTEDLDREAALLMGWRKCEVEQGWHLPNVACSALNQPHEFRPTSDPVDTRALERFAQDSGLTITTVAHATIQYDVDVTDSNGRILAGLSGSDHGKVTTAAIVAALTARGSCVHQIGEASE